MNQASSGEYANDPIHNYFRMLMTFDHHQEMQGVYEKVTRIKNRDLCYSLYKFLWEIKEELILSQA